MRIASTHGHERGSVLLLILGLVVLAGLLVTVVIDVSALFLDRRNLIAAADGAALAGAQAIDERTVYESGLPASGPLTLDERRAESLVKDYLFNEGLAGTYDDLAIDVDTTATTVTVRLSAIVRLPVTNAVTPGAQGGVHVDASATARSAVLSGG